MRDAVFVSTARAPIGRAWRGASDAMPSPTLAAQGRRRARHAVVTIGVGGGMAAAGLLEIFPESRS